MQIKITSYLTQPGRISDDELQNLVYEYSNRIEELGRRIEDCFLFLNKGFVSEAVRLATVEPPIIESLNYLTFPRQNEWNQVCSSYNMDILPIDFRMASRVADEIEKYQRIKANCDMMRQLNFEDGHINLKIQVCRNLVKLDPENEIWQANLADLEQSIRN